MAGLGNAHFHENTVLSIIKSIFANFVSFDLWYDYCVGRKNHGKMREGGITND